MDEDIRKEQDRALSAKAAVVRRAKEATGPFDEVLVKAPDPDSGALKSNAR